MDRDGPFLRLGLACALWACSDAAGPANSLETSDGGGTTTRRDAAMTSADAEVRDGAQGMDSGDAALIDADVADSSEGSTGSLYMPETLAETGLYADGSTSALAEGVTAFEPRYPLWSDGADKQRWLLLPEGAQIDSSDMDYFRYPVGTKAWKEFSLDGKKLETRLLWKTERGWVMRAFAWNEAETEARAVPEGVTNARGTTHDIPDGDACGECHMGVPDTLLGVSAIQLAHDRPGVTLDGLAQDGQLTDLPAGDYALPDTLAWNALGYMHSNCGSCHNPTGLAWDRVDMQLWLTVESLGDAASTPSYTSTIGVTPTESAASFTARVAAGDAAASEVTYRMGIRGDDAAMPPLASERVDDDGKLLVEQWIESL